MNELLDKIEKLISESKLDCEFHCMIFLKKGIAGYSTNAKGNQQMKSEALLDRTEKTLLAMRKNFINQN